MRLGHRVWLAIPLAALALGVASCGGGTPAKSANSNTTTTGAHNTSTTASTSTTTTTTTFPLTTSTMPSGCEGVAAAAGQSQGAAGTITGMVILTETQGATCTLGGYPSMSLTSASGATIPVLIVDGLSVNVGGAGNQPAANVTLSPTQKVAFWYQYSDVVTGNETSCPTSAKATVTPPGGSRTTAPFTLSLMPCNNGQIRVSPVFASS
ncbi:MAG TPA: DUF4232 domain-containing protein [Acidimicrobiales bacterium]|jgi:hypothetical protein